MTDKLDVDDALAFAGRLADAARAAIAPHIRTAAGLRDKGASGRGGYDPVTEADLAAERAMRALIEAERPEDGIEGEEYGSQPSTSGWTWYLDPVDGTRAFVAGLASWATLIGLVDAEGDARFGVIDQPMLDERYVGWPGGAAFESRGGRTLLQVSGCDDLRRAVIATTDPFILQPGEQGAWTHLRHTARITRYGLDAYGYARLAAGTIDLVAETGLAPHDTAALIPVVRGAGGLACDWRGRPAKPGGRLVCAATEPLLDQALVALSRAAL